MSIELRKKPKQARSLHRFNTILNHAEDMIQSVGVSAFKISDLARQADVNIATIYQYFPNQPSLLRHLMEKNVDALVEAIRCTDEPTTELVDDVVSYITDSHLKFCLDSPVFLQLRGVSQASEELQTLSIQDTHRIAALFVPLISGCFPDASEGKVEEVCFITVETCLHLLQVSLSVEPKRRQNIMAQAKLMMALYLETLA